VESREKGISYVKQKERSLTGLVISCRNCFLKHFIDEKREGKIEVTRRRGGRHKQLLDDLKERRGYWKLNEEVIDRTLWKSRFGRGYIPD
jgi:hypothetical protein